MQKILLVLALASVVLSSCVSYRLDPVPNQDIEVRHERGATYPIYESSKIGMVVAPEFRESELMVKVTVKNNSGKEMYIRDTDFKVEVSEDSQEWSPLKVYASDEYYAKEKRAYTVGAVLMVISATADTASAGYGSSTTSGNVYGSGTYGSYSGSYSGTTTYYDPTAAELAVQRNSQMVSQYAQEGQGWLQLLEDNLFYSKDLRPDETYFGLVFSEKGYGDYYRITCTNPDFEIVRIEYVKREDR